MCDVPGGLELSKEYDPAKPNDYDEFCRRRRKSSSGSLGSLVVPRGAGRVETSNGID